MSNIHKAGQRLPQYEMVGVIEKIIPYLDEPHLLDVIAQCTARREELRREAFRVLSDESGWWHPRSVDEVLSDDAKILILGIMHPIVNPTGGVNKINAIKYLRAQRTGPNGDMSLKEAKDAVEAYQFCVQTGRIPFPKNLVVNGGYDE